MTSYAGEVVRIETLATDVDNDYPFTDQDGTLTITIWDIGDTGILVHEAQMAYDAQSDLWYFLWVSASVPGGYRARVTAHSGPYETWEYKTIRVRQNKVL